MRKHIAARVKAALSLRRFFHRFAMMASTRRGEARYRMLVECSPDGILVHDGQAILFANEALARLVGAEYGAALIGRAVLTLAHPDDGNLLMAPAASPLNSAELPQPLEVRLVAADGAPIEVEAIGQHLVYEGQPAIQIMLRDMRRRRNFERELRDSETRFRRLTELSADWYWEQDDQFRFTKISAREGNSVVANPARLIGKTRWGLPGCDLDDPRWIAHRDTLNAHQPFRNFEYSKIDGRGNKRWCGTSGYPLFDAAGRFKGYQGFARDITQRRQSREELERFRAAVNVLPDTIFIVDLQTLRYVDVNDEACRKLGYAREEIIGMPVWMVLVEYSEDKLREQYARLLQSPDEPDLIITRHQRKDGTTFPVEIRRRVLKTDSSLLVLGAVRDITERLKIHHALEESEQRFRQLAENAPLVFWLEELTSGAALYVSPAYETIWGRPVSEFKADLWKRIEAVHPEDRDRVRASADGRSQGDVHVQYRIVGPDGALRCIEERTFPVRDTEGRVYRIVGIAADITDNKAAEAQIARHGLQQELIAGFGEFALVSHRPEEIFREGARVVAHGLQISRRQMGETASAALSTSASAIDAGRLAELFTLAVEEPLHSAAFLQICGLPNHPLDTEDTRFVQSLANVLSAAIRRHQSEARLTYLAQFDALTGLPNRTLLFDRLTQSLAQVMRNRGQIGVMFLDLDRFKLVNDSLGHAQGDVLLREAAKRLNAAVRVGDTVARVSGDEFVVILYDLGHAEDAGIIADKVLLSLSAPFELQGHEVFIGVSIGISLFPGDSTDPEVLLKNADVALYRAKQAGRNQYQYFTREMNEHAVEKMQLQSDLRHALERNEFVLHYQPRVTLTDRRICGMEALIRWNHSQRGLLLPGAFIPTLEETGFITVVGEWVLRAVCAQIQAWKAAGLEIVPVAINLSARQFQHKNLDGIIQRVIAASGVSAELIELEITESYLMHDPHSAISILRNLKSAGVRVSVDDFGTGYSSLSYLKGFPIDTLKIDHSFVKDIGTESNNTSIVVAIINLAHNLGFNVIAEGVETAAQCAFLREYGCEEAQGYYFARPMPAEEMALRLVPALKPVPSSRSAKKRLR